MKNLSRKFATMTDEERLRFEHEQGRSAGGDSLSVRSQTSP